MARVEWSRQSPDDVEHVIAMLLCRENPRAQRIKPSQGDGGRDVIVPTEDPNTFDVYQVKYFTEKLTPDQVYKIKKSHERVRNFATDRGITIAKWFLAMPKLRLDSDQELIQSLTEAGGFPCEWRGLEFIDGLAATYPAVIDYYFQDGRERLENALQQLTALVRMTTDFGNSAAGSTSIQPIETIAGLRALHSSLNELDPFYYYDFSVTRRLQEPPSTSDGLVAFAQLGHEDQHVSFAIYARCAESVIERPIPIKVTMRAARGSAEARQIEELHRYGRPLDTPVEAEYDIDLPGGLGGVSTGRVLMRTSDAAAAGGHELYFELIDPDSDPVARAHVRNTPPSVGDDGRGLSNQGREQNGVFTVESLSSIGADGSISMQLRFRLEPLTDRFSDEVLDGLKFLAHLTPDNRLRFRSVRGPSVSDSVDLPPEVRDLAVQGRPLWAYARALVAIQAHTTESLRLPSKITIDEYRCALEAERLMAGETIAGTWARFSATIGEGEATYDWSGHPPGPIQQEQPFQLPYDGKVITIGYCTIELVSAKVAAYARQENGDHILTLEPAEDDQMTTRWSASSDQLDGIETRLPTHHARTDTNIH